MTRIAYWVTIGGSEPFAGLSDIVCQTPTAKSRTSRPWSVSRPSRRDRGYRQPAAAIGSGCGRRGAHVELPEGNQIEEIDVRAQHGEGRPDGHGC